MSFMKLRPQFFMQTSTNLHLIWLGSTQTIQCLDYDLAIDTEVADPLELLLVNLIHRINGHSSKISCLFLKVQVGRIKLKSGLPELPSANAETAPAIP